MAMPEAEMTFAKFPNPNGLLEINMLLNKTEPINNIVGTNQEICIFPLNK
jgi:hypothetical protein